MNTQDIANDLVTLCRAGKFDEAGEKHWADNVLSIEPDSGMEPSRGKQAARDKGEWWVNAHDIHGFEVAGPYVNGDQFAVRFTIDQTVKQTGQRMTLDEIGLYTLKDGRIAEERFFYVR